MNRAAFQMGCPARVVKIRHRKAGAVLLFLRGLLLLWDVNATVRHKLSEARGRLIRNNFLHGLAWALLFGACLVVIVRASGLGGPHFWRETVPLAFGAPLLVTLVISVFRWRSLDAVAREVDARAGTKDRFWAELHTPGETPWSEAVHREVASYAENLRLAVWRRSIRGILSSIRVIPQSDPIG